MALLTSFAIIRSLIILWELTPFELTQESGNSLPLVRHGWRTLTPHHGVPPPPPWSPGPPRQGLRKSLLSGRPLTLRALWGEEGVGGTPLAERR